ncbi:MAG: MATE family efflux transporter [Anaerolineae bacterium]|nr:MATE family efflux transporter [Anaerolineae bacterium]
MINKPHPFIKHPHRTLLALSFPVLLSMTAEPITGLVDTAFIASLGSASVAALGVGTTALSSLFWIFSFLSISAQTEVAQAHGKGVSAETRQTSSLALMMAIVFGFVLIAWILPASNWIAGLLGASGEIQAEAVTYMQIRIYGAPAVLLMLVSFGVLRGLQDMRTPFLVAVGSNALNVILDWLLIFGNGPFPEMGVAGSALASTISQWVGAIAVLSFVAGKHGLSFSFSWQAVIRLLRVGGDLFIRTGLLTIFLAATTRAATRIGADAGAAHQAIRQIFVFTSLALDAYAITVQSLVGYFVGQNSINLVKRVVKVGMSWSVWTGVAFGIMMWLGRGTIIAFLLPSSAISVFLPAWALFSISLPINSLAFLTDGVHWGTGDYKYLRNAMVLATLVGFISLSIINPEGTLALFWVWIAVGAWTTVRAATGLIRIWPGIGKSVFSSPSL